jgi:hypothetical protein
MTKYIYFFAALLFFAAGFFAGRKTAPLKSQTTLMYVMGETVYDTLEVLRPYLETYTDTVFYTQIVEKPVYVYDSVRLREAWDDYCLTRRYALDFSSDTTGVFAVDLTVSRNRAVLASATIAPLYKVICVESMADKRLFEAFFSAGYSTLGTVSLGGGLFYHSLGVEYLFQKQMGTGTGHCFSLKWRI